MADIEDLRSLLPVPLHLPEAMAIVQVFLKTPEGIKQLHEWMLKPSKYDDLTKVNFLWAMGITVELVRNLMQPPENECRDPPSPIETEALLLLSKMAKMFPTGHQFFVDVINSAGAGILLDYIDRLSVEIPDSILNHVAQTLEYLTSKTPGQSTAVAEGIRGNPTTLKNLVGLIASALGQMDRGVSTAPAFLESLLIVTLHAVSHSQNQAPSSFTPEAVREMLSTLDYVFFADSVESRAPSCIRHTGRIYIELFTKVEDHEERYRVIEDILNSTEYLLSTWIDLLAYTENFEIKNSIIDILTAILRLGSQDQKQRISDSGVLPFLKSLLTLNDDEIGNKVIDMIVLLTNNDGNYLTLNRVFHDPEIDPFIVNDILRACEPDDQSPPSQPQQINPQFPPDDDNE